MSTDTDPLTHTGSSRRLDTLYIVGAGDSDLSGGEGSINQDPFSRRRGYLNFASDAWGGFRRFAVTHIRAITNTVALVCNLALAYFTYWIYTSEGSSDKNLEKTVTFVGFGLITRVLAEANLSHSVRRSIHNFLARVSWEVYLILYQFLINFQNQVDVFIALIFAWAGWHFLGTFTEALRMTRQEGNQETKILGKTEVVNRKLNFSLDNPKALITWEFVQMLVGAGLTTYGHLDPTPASLAKVYQSVGYYLLTKPIGKALMAWVFKTWQKAALTTELNMETPFVANVSLWEKTTGKVIYISQQAIPYFLVIPLLIENPLAFVGLGVIGGAADLLETRDAQVLTQEIYQARKEKNTRQTEEGKTTFSRALIIDWIASGIFMVGVTAYTAAIAYDDDGYDRYGISSFVASVLSIGGLSIYTLIKFQPGESNRWVNQMWYTFMRSNDLPILFFSIQSVSAFNDVALANDSRFQYGVATGQIVLYGALLAANRARACSPARLNPSFPPPIYIMLIVRRVFHFLQGNPTG